MRTRIYALLDPNSEAHGARRVRALEVLLIVIGISSVSAGTVEGLAPGERALAATIAGGVAGRRSCL